MGPRDTSYRLLLGRRTGYGREWIIGSSHWGGRLHGICARNHAFIESSKHYMLYPNPYPKQTRSPPRLFSTTRTITTMGT
jgi:hypothetical protein